MALRVGITTRPDERKEEWLKRYPLMGIWRIVGPFDSRAAARAWEAEQALAGARLGTPVEKSGDSFEADSPDAKWFGYMFETRT
jgi:hypothetical protein